MHPLLASRPINMRVCLSNWFISEQTHFKLIDDFSTLRTGSVLHPPHPLAGQFIFFYKGILSV